MSERSYPWGMRRSLVTARLRTLGRTVTGPVAAGVLSFFCLSGPPVASRVAWAQPAPRAPVVRREGDYTGVSPGQPPSPEGKPRRALRKGTLSWIGFQPKDGGAEVFLQSPTKFELEQRMEGSTLVVHLAGLTGQVHNTRRAIDTRFFDNPLARITSRLVRRSGKRPRGVELRIVFKNPKDARQGTLRTATEADGLFYAYLTFPEGAEPAAETDRSGAASSPDAPDVPDGN